MTQRANQMTAALSRESDTVTNSTAADIVHSPLHVWTQRANEDIYSYCDRLEASLRDHEERLTAIINGSNIGIWDWVRDNDVIRVSGQFFAMLGLEEPKQKIRLRGLMELIHPEDRLKLQSQIRRYLKSEQRFSIDCRFAALGGEYRWVNLSGVVSERNGRVSRISGSLEDISQRVEACKAQLESEAKFEETFKQSHMGLVTIGMDGKIQYANRSFCQLLGYSEDELSAKSIIEITHPDDLAKTLERASQLVAGNELVAGFEKRYVRKDGSTVWVQVRSVIHRNPEGTPVYYISEVTDISQAKRVEDENRELAAALRHAQTMETLGTLAGGLAHDLNNLLTPIMGYTDMAIQTGKSSPGNSEYLSVVLENANRARDLVRQILMICRKQEEDTKVVKLSTVVNDCAKLLYAALPAGVNIRHIQESDRDFVLGDPLQLHQVLMNLGTNAAYAMRDSGGTLGFRISERVISEDVFGAADLPTGQCVCLEVIDSGHGMDEQTITRIFEPFFTTKPPNEGTGLGLFVVKGIIRRHNGAIEVSSSLGQGTSIQILFPRSEVQDENSEHSMNEIVGGNERILWVDDDEYIVDLGKRMLEFLGYEAVCSTSAFEAAQILMDSADEFDLIITDSAMPGCSGEQFASSVRAARSDLPIILCTGLTPSASDDSFAPGPTTAFLQKPFSVRELAAAIRSTLHGTGTSHLSPAILSHAS